VFLTIEDNGTVTHYALLNAWPRSGGTPRHLGGSSCTGFNAAQAFHVAGREGHLILLDSDDDVVYTQGERSFGPPPAPYASPVGLDARVFAQGGVDLGSMSLVHAFYDVPGSCEDWYIQTWTIPINLLTGDGVFAFSLHATESCGNDQIGMKGHIENVPEPASVLLSIIGVILFGSRRRAIR